MPEQGLNKFHDESRQGEALPVTISSTEPDKKFYIESYGCQMNFADSEVVASILNSNGFGGTDLPADADVILINTYSIKLMVSL